ncbi:unnamed protein product [Linum trigynum]|uniref:F-box domain-containing protein n=1 Tax=Linum trigynum TaxID=586398 RepID=A0AAV2DQC0_9ROSI
MNNNSSGCELAKAGKRRRQEGEEVEDTTAMDRLTHLPRPIIHHILSFLDTKYAVQTCVLSREWRCAWKYVPVLRLHSDSFEQYSSFQIYVDHFLFLRFPLSVRKVSYADNGDSEEQDVHLFARVFDYTLSRGAQHLAMDLHSDLEVEEFHRFSDLFSPSSNSSLITLVLESVAIDSGFRSFGFEMLTTLSLRWCPVSFDEEEDLFSNFPCLQNLSILDCTNVLPYHMSEECLKVYGLQMLSLNLQSMSFSKIEIVAPKLRRFHLFEDSDNSSDFPELSLASLDSAVVHVYPDYGAKKKEWVEQHLISLFQGLHNAETLTLHGIAQVLSDFDQVLEKQPSPFTRLKHLNLNSDSVPYAVVDYFLKGTSFAEPIVEFG